MSVYIFILILLIIKYIYTYALFYKGCSKFIDLYTNLSYKGNEFRKKNKRFIAKIKSLFFFQSTFVLKY